jgi:hypothetical protein
VAEVEANVRLWQHPIPADFWRDLQSEGLVAATAQLPH